MSPIGGHEVFGLHGPQGDHVFVSAVVAHDADRLNRQKHGKVLGGLPVPAGFLQLFEQDGVRLVKCFQARCRGGTEAAHRVPWTRKRAFSMRLASSLKTSIKTWPMRRRFSCGSVMSVRAVKNRSRASTT